MRTSYEDYEAVAGLAFGSLDDGAFHKAMGICIDYKDVRHSESKAVVDDYFNRNVIEFKDW